MNRLSTCTVALMLLLPGSAAAQGPSPIPDHWLTRDSLAAALGLSEQQVGQVSIAYEAVNRVLQAASVRREELKATFQGTRPVAQMSEDERKALGERLELIRVEFGNRQSELEGLLGDLRALLSADARLRFDALQKPRLVPEAKPPTQGTP